MIRCYDFGHMLIDYSQRKKLKALAHHLKPVVNIGKEGVSDGVIYSISEKLEKNELIKIKFSHHKDQKSKISDKILNATNAIKVSIIGNILIIYKKSENQKNRHIKI